MTDGLAQVIYGVSDESETNDIELLARTEGITLQTASVWRTASPLVTRASNGRFDGHTLGFFIAPDGTYIVARARFTPTETPLYTYTRVPRQVMRSLGGNIMELIEALPDYSRVNEPTLPQPVPPTPRTWPFEARLKAFNDLLADFDGDIHAVLSLLNAAISKQRLLIGNHPGTTADRLKLVSGLMALLPACARADLTFSTEFPPESDVINGRVAFGVTRSTRRHAIDWNARASALNDVPHTAYIDQLLSFWADDAAQLLEAIDVLDPLAERVPVGDDLINRLDDLTARYTFYTYVNEHDNPPVEDLKESLEHAAELPVNWRREYARRLLPHALENRDTEAGSMIAEQMDADDVLDDALQEEMTSMLDDTPDLVYVFMRQRLSEGVDERWLERLHDAAIHSLGVALDSGDPELMISWFRLIAREPKRFELEDILRRGMRSAALYGYENTEFARSLLILAARFLADMLDELLADEDFVAALPASIQRAFNEHDREALADLQAQSTSLFLAGIWRAAKAKATGAFGPRTLERVWTLKQGEKKYNTAAPYTPDAILTLCAQEGADWLPASAIQTFLARLLTDKDDPLFKMLTDSLSERDKLAEMLAGAFIQSEQNVNGALDTVSMLMSARKLTASGALKVHTALLDAWGWAQDTQPIIEAAARLLAQNNGTSLPPSQLNTMLEAAAQLRDEMVAKAAALMLLREAAEIEDEETFAEELRRVFSLLAWSTTARAAALEWWRRFLKEQPTARLTRLSGMLAGARVMEDALETLRSMSAMRRLIGKRDVQKFAEDVNTAYAVLEMLAEAFEPAEKTNPVGFDPETVRDVLAQIAKELTPHQRQILSNSLKGLAGLVSTMGDNRTKAGIARRSDNIDRQLMSGEQAPQGAVDVMKWIAGYLAGAQQQDDDTE